MNVSTVAATSRFQECERWLTNGSAPPSQKSLHCRRKALSAKIMTAIIMNIPEGAHKPHSACVRRIDDLRIWSRGLTLVTSVE